MIKRIEPMEVTTLLCPECEEDIDRCKDCDCKLNSWDIVYCDGQKHFCRSCAKNHKNISKNE